MSDDFDGLALAKQLLRTGRSGALGTLTLEGAPFTSLTTVATMPDGAPILLLSRLAAHTRHLERDGRCSLLLADIGRGDPLAHPRLSLTGTAVRADSADGTARRRFLARNPKAKLYADFPDFSFWIVALAEAHLNGGFARAAQFIGAEIATPVDGCDDLLAGEEGALEHMNTDHREALAAYATGLAGRSPGDWRSSGIDPEGIDLISGDVTCRVPFPNRITSLAGLRRVLVELAAKARTTNP